MLIGQKIIFSYKGQEYAGTYISSGKNTITVKLGSGYNITVDASSIEIKKEYSMEKGDKPGAETKNSGCGENGVCILTTGGTIASSVDYTTGAVKPVKDISYLYNFVNNISQFKLYHESIDNILSENVNAEKWVQFARKARDAMKKGNSVIIFHGTDTMQYSASALSFMFEEQTEPIIFTGSQRSSDRPSSDAFLNIEGSIHFASTDMGEVGIAMHTDTSDDSISLYRATRARKMHTSSRDAFKSISEPPLGLYADGKVKEIKNIRHKSDSIILKDRLDKNIGLIYFYPGMAEDDFYNLSYNKKAVIIMGTGLGHTSTGIIEVIRKLSRETHFFMTSQCIYGNVNMNVYSTGRELIDAGVIPLQNMLAETAMVKAMYLSANYPDNFVELMQKNLRGEFEDTVK
ncbi:Glu-tRNA(Gln) amidotransferase subunit GatD [Ferroplasma acidiphilum]|uniref:Glu-tRNA(Gln) amidotransferase subunit GatD n=1 Tax=Ferroplasma acidiphilum TaxID=74969 RepID=UPI002815252B|nr:Glu-tRNA(Gln) amidotransferase subunit GatD [Ferroplasma acidiphilum]WMT53459.1 MAG: Glu-tRNA(Gln) amidotransferase subunit GatD [Ferroplasma acidiphilum]